MMTSRRTLGIGRRSLVAAGGSLLAAPALLRAPIARAAGQGGIALVIGHSKYDWEASLPNVKRDVADVAQRFEALGLKTELLQDLRHDAMGKALDKFTAALRGANLAALYFAGHGVFWQGKSYLVPVDSNLGNPATALKSLFPVSATALRLKEATNRLIVFDSCRNNPADGWAQRHARLSAGTFLAESKGADHTCLLQSTAPGGLALDGPAGQNSPFAAAFLRQLAAPSVDLQPLAANVRRDLLLATEGRQLVYDYGVYSAPFVLSGKPGAAPPAGHDPSRLVELSNAYAYAQKNNLYLPAGLVAYRPAGAAEAQRIGAYAVDFPATVANLIIVTSVADGDSAEVVWATNNSTNTAITRGPFYLPIRASKSGNSLEWTNGTETVTYTFKWRDRDSGTFSNLATGNGGIPGAIPAPARFTRLDG